jgi:DNA-directed RNA polymerase specialized sigma24 family protein|tara:strand:- start:1795 stop:2475 length:681 start_codon:yes stop_codon:yes gene_type:complete
MPKRKLKYEDCVDLIDLEIAKRRGKWNLKVIKWMDFDDVSQILRFHIFKKWHLYDQTKLLQPWLNRTISNQIKNLIRNNYGNYAKPCLKCAASEHEDMCSIYGSQNSGCPLFRNWEKGKKNAYNTKLPVSLDAHVVEFKSKQSEELNFEKAFEQIVEKIQPLLKPIEKKVFHYMFIEALSEEQTAKKLGYRTKEKTKSPGYKQVKTILKCISMKAKKLLNDDEIIF